jgi:hypothetical protein
MLLLHFFKRIAGMPSGLAAALAERLSNWSIMSSLSKEMSDRSSSLLSNAKNSFGFSTLKLS